jgi:hypothetical protein
MKCSYCDQETELPFHCSFCDSYFCEEHRLPEAHRCSKELPRTPLGSYQTKKTMAQAKSQKERTYFKSEGDLHFVKKTLPTFDHKTLEKVEDKKRRFRLLRRKKK